MENAVVARKDFYVIVSKTAYGVMKVPAECAQNELEAKMYAQAYVDELPVQWYPEPTPEEDEYYKRLHYTVHGPVSLMHRQMLNGTYNGVGQAFIEPWDSAV